MAFFYLQYFSVIQLIDASEYCLYGNETGNLFCSMESWESKTLKIYFAFCLDTVITEGLDLANFALHALKLNRSKVCGLTV